MAKPLLQIKGTCKQNTSHSLNMFLLPLIIRFILGFLLIKLVGAEVTQTTAEKAAFTKVDSLSKAEKEECETIFTNFMPDKLTLRDIFSNDSKVIYLVKSAHKHDLKKFLSSSLTSNDMSIFMRILTESRLSAALIELMKDDYNVNFNNAFGSGCYWDIPLIENNGHCVDTQYLTPLMLAIVVGNERTVELLVKTKLKTPLEFNVRFGASTGHLAAARDIARKIMNKDKRHRMLGLLKYNPALHGGVGIMALLKCDMSVSVKEAVMMNNYGVMNAALNVGNFGDKEDVEIVRRAIMNSNEDMVEALVLEGYKVPTGIQIPSNTTIKSDQLKKLLAGNPVYKPNSSKYTIHTRWTFNS
jgi:hypothetical protein